MEKVITRGKYRALIDKINTSKHGQINWLPDCDARYVADQALAELGIAVEPEPILPGVTPGEWDCKQRNLANRRDEDFPCEVWGYSEEGIKMTIGWVRRLEDAVPMACVKKLVELLVASYREVGLDYDSFIPETRAVIDQLEKMGVAADEFRGK